MDNTFDEELAKKIIKNHKLSETTFRVWKNRGTIPKKYFKEGYKKPVNVKDNATLQKIRGILDRKDLNHTNFRTGNLHPNYLDSTQRMQDIYRGMPFIKGEEIALKTEITELRNLARKVMDTRSLSSMNAFIADVRIKWTIVLGATNYGRIKNASLFEKEHIDEIVLAITAFYNQIRL